MNAKLRLDLLSAGCIGLVIIETKTRVLIQCYGAQPNICGFISVLCRHYDKPVTIIKTLTNQLYDYRYLKCHSNEDMLMSSGNFFNPKLEVVQS
jgi:hypothetical protein